MQEVVLKGTIQANGDGKGLRKRMTRWRHTKQRERVRQHKRRISSHEQMWVVFRTIHPTRNAHWGPPRAWCGQERCQSRSPTAAAQIRLARLVHNCKKGRPPWARQTNFEVGTCGRAAMNKWRWGDDYPMNACNTPANYTLCIPEGVSPRWELGY